MELKTKKWNKNTEYALGVYKIVTSLLGIWPLENRRIISTFKVFLVALIQGTTVIVYATSWIIHGNCGTIIEILDTVSVITTSSMAIFKVLLSWFHNKKNLFIINSAVEDWQNVDNEESCAIMLQYARIGRAVCIIQMMGAYTTVIPLMLSRPPIFLTIDELYERNITMRNIPIGPNCWITSEISRSLYLTLYFYLCIHLLVIATAYLGGDVFSFGLAMHICGQFELLYQSLRFIEGNESKSAQRENFSLFSKRHKHLLDLANKFEGAFNMLIFVELGANTVLIAASEIMLLWGLKVHHAQLVLIMIVRMYLLYIQIFMYSFVGEKLSNKAEKLQVAIYNCPWYNMPSVIVKDMRFIMMRNNYLFHLTAGKIYHMNYENFKNIVKSMFSYFSILRLIFNDN